LKAERVNYSSKEQPKMAENITEKTAPILAAADILAWHQTSNCRLELYERSLIIKKRKSFWQKPLIISEIGTDQIDSFGLGEEPTTELTLWLDDGVAPRHQEIFKINDQTQTSQMFAALKTLLGPLDEVSRSTRKTQEQERAKREEADKIENDIRDYTVYFWTIAARLIHIAGSLYSIVAALITESWETVQRNYQIIWQQTENLQQETGADLISNLQSLGESCRENNGMEVVRQVARYLASMVTCIQGTPPDSRWQNSKAVLKILPNWEHLQFLLLFSTWQNEIVLDGDLGDWVSAEKGMAKLANLQPIMSQIIGLDTGDRVAQLLNTVRLKDKVLLKGAANNLNTYLIDCTKQRPYQKVN